MNKATNEHYILKRGLIFLAGGRGEWKHDERKVIEEYWWAITQAAGPSGCYRSGSSWMDFGFKLYSLACTYIVAHVNTQLRLTPGCTVSIYWRQS
jgi:hypothetical protein